MADETANKPPRKSTLPEWAKSGASVRGRSAKAAPGHPLGTGTLGLVAGGVLVFGLVAFAAGWQIAKKTTTTRLEAKYKAELDRITRAMMATQTGAPPGGAAPAAHPPMAVSPAGGVAHPSVAVAAKTGDPREAGLNYLRLCQVPQAEAEKYAVFLLTETHRTWRVPLAGRGGTPMVTLYAVDRGFRLRDHAERVELEKYRAGLLALGDKWARKNKGGNPFKSAYPEKYSP